MSLSKRKMTRIHSSALVVVAWFGACQTDCVDGTFRPGTQVLQLVPVMTVQQAIWGSQQPMAVLATATWPLHNAAMTMNTKTQRRIRPWGENWRWSVNIGLSVNGGRGSYRKEDSRFFKASV